MTNLPYVEKTLKFSGVRLSLALKIGWGLLRAWATRKTVTFTIREYE